MSSLECSKPISNAAPSEVYDAYVIPEIKPVDLDALSWKGDLLVVGIVDNDVEVPTGQKTTLIVSQRLKKLDQAYDGAFSAAIERCELKSGKGKTSVVRGSSSLAKNILIVGLGVSTSLAEQVNGVWGASAFHTAGKVAAAAAKECRAKLVAVEFPPACDQPSIGPTAAEHFCFTLIANLYETRAFMKNVTITAVVESVQVNLFKSNVQPSINRGIGFGKGNVLTKRLVETPANVCTPTFLADAAKYLATLFPDVLTCNILEREDCVKLGMGSYLAVSECAAEPPKFIHLKYAPPNAASDIQKIAIVGKGLTFDAGGYNIKTFMIEQMKLDMGGSGAVLGAARIIAETTKPAMEVHFVIAACENMIDGKGMRPGDVIKSASGLTIEVLNTDAEGRLTLCDAMWYAQEKLGVKLLIDIATLTGTQMSALGKNIGAVLGVDGSDMVSNVIEAARTVGERVWQLPLEEEYADELKSICADTTNLGSRWGGVITATLFLKKFVQEGVDWAHLDVAGPVFDEKTGASGYGAALLASIVDLKTK